MSILVIAEHDNKTIKSNTLNTIHAATKLSGDIHVLVVGFQCQQVAEQVAKISDVKKVICADHEVYQHHLPENLALLIKTCSEAHHAILAPASTWGKNLLPRVAALLDVNQISDITSIESDDTFIRPIYAGNAFATVKSSEAVKVLTVRSTAFPQQTLSETACAIEMCDVVIENNLSHFEKQELTVSERPELTSAKVVISGGRGMQNGENFKILEQLADVLNAAIGASRAAVDAGFVPNDYQVGQTGKIVAPQLYIAIGISGAIQHLAGMKDSKTIVAINKDEDAPIFQIADYGLVADLFEAVPKLTELLQARKS